MHDAACTNSAKTIGKVLSHTNFHRNNVWAHFSFPLTFVPERKWENCCSILFLYSVGHRRLASEHIDWRKLKTPLARWLFTSRDMGIHSPPAVCLFHVLSPSTWSIIHCPTEERGWHQISLLWPQLRQQLLWVTCKLLPLFSAIAHISHAGRKEGNWLLWISVLQTNGPPSVGAQG